MNGTPPKSYTSFNGYRRIASGSLPEIALAVKRAIENGAGEPILTYDDATGRAIDFDSRGGDEEVAARFSQPAATAAPTVSERESRGRGRPKLGVVAREVTLLPRHWDWLNAQPGGASVALRKLVDEARRVNGGRDKARDAREAAYYFMSAMAGDLPGFEEAARALFAGDRRRFEDFIAAWPNDVRCHAVKLAFAKGD